MRLASASDDWTVVNEDGLQTDLSSHLRLLSETDLVTILEQLEISAITDKTLIALPPPAPHLDLQQPTTITWRVLVIFRLYTDMAKMLLEDRFKSKQSRLLKFVMANMCQVSFFFVIVLFIFIDEIFPCLSKKDLNLEFLNEVPQGGHRFVQLSHFFFLKKLPYRSKSPCDRHS